MLETDVSFNSNMISYTSETLKKHNAEMITLKSQVEAAHEQIRANESKFKIVADQLEIA